MPEKHHVKFIEKIIRTPAAISYRFTKPKGFEFNAGQYMLVDLGNDLVHPLSLSCCPEETMFIEFTKRMTGSPYCRRLESLQDDEVIHVKGPHGKFCCHEDDEAIVMLAGGIGITPVISILKSLENRKETSCSILLIYGNLNKEDVAFLSELENLQLPQFRLVHVLSDTAGIEGAHQGFITHDIISKEIAEMDDPHFMISGPPVMVEAMKEALKTLCVPETFIRTDIFFGYE